MIPKYGCLLLGLLTVCGAAAQHPDDEYYPYAARQEERTPLLLTDSTLFYRAVQTTPDLYAEHTAFNLPYVSVKRRGLNYRDESASVGGVRLSSRYFGAMRLLGPMKSAMAVLPRQTARRAVPAACVCSVLPTITHRRRAMPPSALRTVIIWPGRGCPSPNRSAAIGAARRPSTPVRGETCTSKASSPMR